MPKIQTPASRAALVADAAKHLAGLVNVAQDWSRREGPTGPNTVAAWEAVERQGATVHRQSRFLAGKGKGG